MLVELQSLDKSGLSLQALCEPSEGRPSFLWKYKLIADVAKENKQYIEWCFEGNEEPST